MISFEFTNGREIKILYEVQLDVKLGQIAWLFLQALALRTNVLQGLVKIETENWKFRSITERERGR